MSLANRYEQAMPIDLRAGDGRAWVRYLATLCAIGLGYFALARFGLALASINPSATPIWPPTGLAVAAVLLGGYRVWPAIFVAAFVVNLATAGSLATSLAIGAGNTLECLVTGLLVNRYADGKAAFSTPMGVVRFVALSLAPGTLISATIGVGSLALAGFVAQGNVPAVWLTWWLGDVAGALLVAPAVVLWATAPARAFRGNELAQSALVFAIAAVVGLLAFSPLFEQSPTRGPLSFLAILPLILAAMYRGQRDTALAALLLSGFAIWGTLMNGGPFAHFTTLNESFLMLLAFIISTSVPSLVLSADVAMRRRMEAGLRTAHDEANQRILQRTSELERAIGALQAEVEERREIEAELREQRVHLLEAQRLANLGSWVWDIQRGQVIWSQQLFEIYGIAPREFGGTFDDYLARVHADDRDRVRREIFRAYREAQSFRIEERIVRPNGDVRHLQSTGEVIRDDHGEPIRMLGICHDISDRKSAENALRKSEAQYRMLIDSVHDYAIFMLDPEGHVMSWNAGAARIMQYRTREILGQHFSRFYTPEDRADGLPQRALAQAAAGKYEAEGQRLRKDGSHFWVSVVIDPIRDESDRLIGFAKVTRDITERHNAERALDEAREKLAQSQKMEALGQLTGGIAHDFNNLLMIVSGHAQMLRRGVSEEKRQRAIEAISTAAGRGERLTRQLLAFARRQPLSPVVVDVKERIEAVREMIGSSLRGNIELFLRLPEGLWPTEVDLNQLELALLNITVNARDAMPDGGTLTLSARNVAIEPGEPPGDLAGDFVALSLADTGVGIARELLPKVFEPFFTTKSVGKGTGLGLSQVYGFAHQSGGSVMVESEVGRGTTITIYLPRSTKAAEPVTAGDEAEPAPLREGTILVVEDNKDVADVTAGLLARLGYAVRRAENASEALAQLEQEAIDLVFSDVVMPGPMDGLALAREIRARHPYVPVLLTSGYSDLAPGREVEFRILRKPFDMAVLDAHVRELVAAAHRRQRASITTASTS